MIRMLRMIRMIRMMCRLPVLAMLPLLTGCYSFASYGRARVLDKGDTEVWAAPEALVYTSGSGASIRPVVDMGARYGLTRSIELDGHLSTFGATLGPRIQLLRSASPVTGLDIAVAPAASFTYPDKVALELPVLLGWNLPHKHQIILAPRITYLERFGVAGFDRPISFLFAGGSVGFAYRVSRSLTIMPEVAFLGQLYAEPGFNSNVGGGLGMQGGIGFLYDF